MSGPSQLRLTILGVTVGATLGVALLSGHLGPAALVAIGGTVLLAVTFAARRIEPPGIPRLVLPRQARIGHAIVTVAGIALVLFTLGLLVSTDARSAQTHPGTQSPTLRSSQPGGTTTA